MAPWFIHSLHPFFYIQKGKFMENEKKMICGANGKACECKGGCFACKIGEEFRVKFGAALADER